MCCDAAGRRFAVLNCLAAICTGGDPSQVPIALPKAKDSVESQKLAAWFEQARWMRDKLRTQNTVDAAEREKLHDVDAFELVR
eukprot:scaffold95_cov476-Prasinococcus_capsulatus_cf.AAC.1